MQILLVSKYVGHIRRVCLFVRQLQFEILFLAELVKLRRFAGKLSVVPPTPHAPHPTTDGDAVGTLLDICVQREFPLPTYVIAQTEPFHFAIISILS